MMRLSIAASGLAAVLTLAACSSSGGGSTNTSQPPASQPASSQPASVPVSGPKITIKNFGYSGDLTVKAGATVTVVNEDSTAHTLTDKQSQKFDTGSIAAGGGTGTFKAPTTPGTYPFGCTFHPDMSGTLTVTS